VLAIAWIVIVIALQILRVFLLLVPGIGWTLFGILGIVYMLVVLCFFVVWLIQTIKAFQGAAQRFPIISDWNRPVHARRREHDLAAALYAVGSVQRTLPAACNAVHRGTPAADPTHPAGAARLHKLLLAPVFLGVLRPFAGRAF